MSDTDLLMQIREIMLQHIGWDNAIKSNILADMIGVKAGASNINIRGLVKDAMKKYRLPIGTAGNKGYFLISTPEELRSSLLTLEKRILETENRKNLLIINYASYYNVTPMDPSEFLPDDEGEIDDNIEDIG